MTFLKTIEIKLNLLTYYFHSETEDGTVEVVFDLISVDFFEEDILQQTLSDAVASGQLGSLSVSPEITDLETGGESPGIYSEYYSLTLSNFEIRCDVIL